VADRLDKATSNIMLAPFLDKLGGKDFVDAQLANYGINLI
jgi:hypothetical protein